jgi:MFS family permease
MYVFAILFGFGMGADYMLIPLMAAEQFGVNTLARAMAIILPADTIGQTWFPYAVARLRLNFGNYETALLSVFALAAIGCAAIALLPKYGRQDETLHLPKPERAAARR